MSHRTLLLTLNKRQFLLFTRILSKQIYVQFIRLLSMIPTILGRQIYVQFIGLLSMSNFVTNNLKPLTCICFHLAITTFSFCMPSFYSFTMSVSSFFVLLYFKIFMAPFYGSGFRILKTRACNNCTPHHKIEIL